mgnify:CR=1 FL=1
MKAVCKIWMLCLATMLFVRCASNETANSDTVKQSEIYQNYSVSYNNAEKELTATASFRFGGANGTTLLLVKPSGVLFENQEMPNENNVFSGTYYEMNIQTDLKAGYTFVYTDGDGKTYTNHAVVIPAEIKNCPLQIDKNKGFSVEWDYPLQNGETINLYIEDKSNNSSFVFNNVVGSKSMKMNTDELKNITPGEVDIYLVRSNASALANATHLGGKMTASYTSRKIEVKLVGQEPKNDEEDTLGNNK